MGVVLVKSVMSCHIWSVLKVRIHRIVGSLMGSRTGVARLAWANGAGWVRGVIGAWLVGICVTGCALVSGGQGTGSGGVAEAWLGYLRGDDLQAACDIGVPDRLRVITHAGGKDRFRAIEMVGDPAGGALVAYRWVSAKDLSQSEPLASWRAEGRQRRLSPQEFKAVISWFNRLGLLSPGAAEPAGVDHNLEWLVSGCLDGSWFQNTNQPPDSQDGIDISDGYH